MKSSSQRGGHRKKQIGDKETGEEQNVVNKAWSGGCLIVPPSYKPHTRDGYRCKRRPPLCHPPTSCRHIESEPEAEKHVKLKDDVRNDAIDFVQSSIILVKFNGIWLIWRHWTTLERDFTEKSVSLSDNGRFLGKSSIEPVEANEIRGPKAVDTGSNEREGKWKKSFECVSFAFSFGRKRVRDRYGCHSKSARRPRNNLNWNKRLAKYPTESSTRWLRQPEQHSLTHKVLLLVALIRAD